MTPHELAHALHGRPRGREVPSQLVQYAGYVGLVVAYGADDRMRFVGALTDAATAPGLVSLDRQGVIRARDHPIRGMLLTRLCDATSIEAEWRQVEPYQWTYRTSIPHATFDILEDAGLYCRGIVFRLDDLS